MAAEAKAWVDSDERYEVIREAFESTSRFAKLQKLKTAIAGRALFICFTTKTSDAMSMDTISKGTEKALEAMQRHFSELVTLVLSGNYSTHYGVEIAEVHGFGVRLVSMLATCLN